MKVYAIKNKEGKYLFTDGGYCYNFHKNIYDATFYGNKDDATVELKYRYNITSQLSMNKNLLKTKNDFEDCEIVECTLCEGNLEKELAEYKKALYKYAYDSYKCEICTGDELDETDLNNIQEEIDNVLDQVRKESEGEKDE